MVAIDEHVAFWYGQNYSAAVSGVWEEVATLLERSDYQRSLVRYPSIHDDTAEKIRECYAGLPDYNTHGNVEVICDIRQHDDAKRLTRRHTLPVLMVDAIGLNLPVISYNRIAGYPDSRVFLWPNSYHVKIAQSGLLDERPFLTKEPRCVFRGALSGHMRNREVAPGIVKISRAQYLLSLPAGKPNLDLAVTFVPSHLESEPDYLIIEPHIEKMRSNVIPMEQFFSFRYVLCLEGADISSGLGGILASRSVPLHPYPFSYESWFFDGLVPWVHFVPLKHDGSDILDVLAYCDEHADEMNRISEAGRRFMGAAADPARLRATKAAFVSLWDLQLG